MNYPEGAVKGIPQPEKQPLYVIVPLIHPRNRPIRVFPEDFDLRARLVKTIVACNPEEYYPFNEPNGVPTTWWFDNNGAVRLWHQNGDTVHGFFFRNYWLAHAYAEQLKQGKGVIK